MSNTVRTAVELLKEVLENLPECEHDFSGVSEAIDLLESKDILLIEWSVDDVISRAKDFNENDADQKVPSLEQAREILYELNQNHDCNYGITWDTIDYYL